MHSALYIHAMELLPLGYASAEAYVVLMEYFREGMVKMARHNEARDGLGLEDRPAQWWFCLSEVSDQKSWDRDADQQ